MEGGENGKEDARERVATAGHLATPHAIPTPPGVRQEVGAWAEPRRRVSQIANLRSQIAN